MDNSKKLAKYHQHPARKAKRFRQMQQSEAKIYKNPVPDVIRDNDEEPRPIKEEEFSDVEILGTDNLSESARESEKSEWDDEEMNFDLTAMGENIPKSQADKSVPEKPAFDEVMETDLPFRTTH